MFLAGISKCNLVPEHTLSMYYANPMSNSKRSHVAVAWAVLKLSGPPNGKPEDPVLVHVPQDPIDVPPMSASNQTTDLSNSNLTAIFDAALQEYKTLTRQDLETHPFAAALEEINTPDAILRVFRKQAQSFDKFLTGSDKLMAWLTPIVHILFTFSTTLGEGTGLVSIHSFRSPSISLQSSNHLFFSHSVHRKPFSPESVSFLA
jgi:hypothetical protein